MEKHMETKRKVISRADGLGDFLPQTLNPTQKLLSHRPLAGKVLLPLSVHHLFCIFASATWLESEGFLTYELLVSPLVSPIIWKPQGFRV